MAEFQVPTIEGRVSFSYPGLPSGSETWYRIYGDLQSSPTGRPLICLHGGPGQCHNYMKPMQEFTKAHGIPIILYDQIGCGNSTRLREKRLDVDFWTCELFEAELENLCKHLGIAEYDLLGQSWGGMLAAHYAIKRPQGVKRLVISNSPASMKLWVEACNEWRAELPRDIDETLTKYEEAKDYDNQEYKDAVTYFYKRHMCLKRGENGEDFPRPVMETFAATEEDDTVYFTMNGPSEFTVIGNLKTWSVIGKLGSINVPTLVLNGEFDEAKAVCVRPYADEIPGAVWKTIEGTSHMGHVEKPQEYCNIVMDFFKSTA